MPVALRTIPCLDAGVGRVVKGMSFENLRDVEGPAELVSRYDAEGVDEITFLDVPASSQGRATVLDVIAKTTEEVFALLTVGGGVCSVEDVTCLLAHDADKVGINTAAIAGPDLISRVADRFGDQALVLSVDTRRCPEDMTTASDFGVTTHGGKCSTGINTLGWALKVASLGAGEILLDSMDVDGVRTGLDLEMLNVFRSEVAIPLIASERTGTFEHSLETT